MLCNISGSLVLWFPISKCHQEIVIFLKFWNFTAKIITNLDQKWNLWQKPQENRDINDAKASVDMGIISNNPILNNITDYLIEEASAEEEELLGKNNDLEVCFDYWYFVTKIILTYWDFNVDDCL